MNTNYIYVSNIPSSFKPVLLLHELENKWARMLYLENSFSGLRDAFIYNPTKLFDHFSRGIQRLREKEIDGSKPLIVYYVWFPPENVFISTVIPEGASMLSYIFVENLHKDVISPELIYDLPLQATDIKAWDIPERPDKCIIIKLPITSNHAMRSFILGTLRSRMIRGTYPRVSELIISEDYVLSTNMVPRSIKINETQESFLSNFFYLHEIPSKLTVKMLIEAAKNESIKGCRVFFVETHNNMKYGFMYLPRSLPHTRFMALFDKLSQMEFRISDRETVRIKIQETWFQPFNADPPTGANNQEKGEMMLTDYLHLSGVPANMPATQLCTSCPFPLKISVFPVNELSTQVGFIVVRDLNEYQVSNVMNHFRNLELGGTCINIDEIHIRVKDLPVNLLDRPFQLIPRQSKSCNNHSSKKRSVVQESTSPLTLISPVTISPDECSLMKTEFICIDNLPKNIAKAAVIFDISRPSDGCVIIPEKESSKAFIYYPDCSADEWKALLLKFSNKSFSGRRGTVYEVYLQTGELTANNNLERFEDSNVVFAYNISHDVNIQEIYDIDRSVILFAELLETTNGSKSAFMVLNGSHQNQFKSLEIIRRTYIHGKPVYADIVKLASVMKTANIKRPRIFE